MAHVAEWKKDGACAVGIGSALAARVDSEGYNSVTEIAKEFVAAIGGQNGIQ